MRRYVGMAVGTGLIAVVLSVTGGIPALAQGALKPVVSLIVNDVAHPVPVLVTNTSPPAAPALVKCSLKLSSSTSPGETELMIGGTTVASIQCPAGVTKVDVQRVYFSPELGNMSGGSTVMHWRCTFGLSDEIYMEANDVVAVLTEGSPDSVLSRPLRVDTAAQAYVVYNYRGNTGTTGINAMSNGAIVFEGVPVL